MICLIHYKNFYKCHNVPPPSTTIKNQDHKCKGQITKGGGGEGERERERKIRKSHREGEYDQSSLYVFMEM
jgi:hypothetical protein